MTFKVIVIYSILVARSNTCIH